MLSLGNLVRHAVDYAGLFPPATLPLNDVVRNFAQYRELPSSPMLGRLVLPAGRMEEFAALADTIEVSSPRESPWRISALLPMVTDTDKFSSACQAIDQFNKRFESRGFAVDSLEIKTDSSEGVSRTIAQLPVGIQAFLEIDCQNEPGPSVRVIAEHSGETKWFAKIRTGSIDAGQIPTIEQVARLIGSCATHSVGFKATAGLHHPLRNEYRLTYEPDPPRGIMHGFLNVFVASLVAFDKGVENDVIEEILSETSPANFKFEENLLRWRDFEIASARVQQLRDSAILSFGSCSFLEPTEELQSLGFQHLFAPA